MGVSIVTHRSSRVRRWPWQGVLGKIATFVFSNKLLAMNSSIATDLSFGPKPGFFGLAALLRLNLSGVDLMPLCQSLIQNATENPDDACSLLDASVIFHFCGNQHLALQLQREALNLRRHYVLPARQPVKLRLLALMVPGELAANVPIECLLEASDIDLNIYYVTDGAFDPAEIPEHDVMFVAIGESVLSRPLLDAWLPLLTQWPRPVVVNPCHISRVARDAAACLLSDLDGVAMPPTWRVGRVALQRLAEGAAASAVLPPGVDFPLIVRPLDSHAGHDLYKVDGAAALLDILQSLPGDDFFVSPFIDYRSSDGLFRKYRVILVDGQPFACHMGISSHWMIHYLNAGMADSAEKRAEEALFMAGFEAGFALRHGAALRAINERIGLDYLGIDCAETTDGKLLIFEVDHAMVVHSMDPVDVYPYKQPAMQKIFSAFRAMLFKAAVLIENDEK